MIARTETTQLYFFSILDLFGVAVPPLHRHVRVGVGIHKNVECAVPIQYGEKGHGSRDLSEDGLYLLLDLFLCLLGNKLIGVRLPVATQQMGAFCEELTYSGALFSLSEVF